MATHTTLVSLFTAIADAIRAKNGTNGKIVADNFPDEIANITTGFKVNSITTSGTYDTSTYHGSYWAAIDDNGNLLLVVEGGTSTAYESIYFASSSLPSGVTLVNQSYYSYASMTASKAYVAVYSGVTSSVDIALAFNTRNSSSDHVQCDVTITGG